MSVYDEDECYDLALLLAKTAGEVIRNAVHKVKNIETKSSPRDLVTETDKEVEELLMKKISSTFPDHKFIGEESVSSGMKCQFTDAPTWIIDPIDGTTNFVHGFPMFCVSIALWVNKEPVLGIIYNPMLEHLYTARKGKGAYLNDKRIHASGQTDFTQALIFTEIGSNKNEDRMRIVYNNLKRIMEHAQGSRSLGSAALNMCYVSQGGVDAYYEMGIHAWDMAAGALLVTEAGGYICDISGGPFDLLSRRLICASTKELADDLVSMLEIFEEEKD